MTSFDPTDDQQAFIESVHRFAANDLRKHLRPADETGTVPEQVLAAGWGLGFAPAAIPEKYGGFADEQPAATAALTYEELAWGDLSVALQLLAPTLLAYAVRECGSTAQKEAFLPPLCNAQPPALTAALLEPVHQFNPRALETTARVANGGFVLNGEKAFVPLADGADTILVYAAGEDASTEAFLVSCENPGLEVGGKEKLMGLKALPTFRVTLDDCKLPESARLGEGFGLQIDALLARSNVALAALAVGIGRAALEYARDYAKERVAFGEPIASRQSIAFMLAEMAIEVDATRLMTWEAAWLLDQGEDATEASALARHYADEMALQVADGAVQVLGGHGYIREHPVELWLRNARGFSAMDGMAIL